MLTRFDGVSTGVSLPLSDVLADLPADQPGLVAAIARQFETCNALMFARMNRATIEKTRAQGYTHLRNEC